MVAIAAGSLIVGFALGYGLPRAYLWLFNRLFGSKQAPQPNLRRRPLPEYRTSEGRRLPARPPRNPAHYREDR